MERRLAAIFASDMVGFSRLMEADELGTLNRQKRHRSELIDPKIEQHGGKIIKLTGDGMIAEFPSVVEAVLCAVSVQRKMAVREANIPEERRICYRVAVNLGDVIFDSEDNDIYGDGVNIAARLEGLAEPGGIVVSGTAYDHLKSNVDVGYEDLGEQQVKNISTPIRAYRVVLDGVAAPKRAPGRYQKSLFRALVVVAVIVCVGFLGDWYVSQSSDAAAIDIDKVLSIKGPMVAVIPFENRGNKAHDGFAHGMTEQVVAALTRFGGIRVMAPRLAASKDGSIAELREIGARYIVDGSVVRTDNAVRTTVAMSNAITGDQIWADTFKAKLTPENVYDVQEKVSARIAASIASDFSGPIALDRLKDASSKPPESMEALDCVQSASSWVNPEDQIFRSLQKYCQ